MRTTLFLIAGFLLLGALLVVARLFSAHVPNATAWAIGVFVVVWFVVTAANLAVGVWQAGYSVMEELPIFLLLFVVPVAVGLCLKWKVL